MHRRRRPVDGIRIALKLTTPLFLACVVLAANPALTLAAIGQGTAPVTVPAGGFGIDGNLGANVPTLGIGDWVPGVAGAGGSVLNAAGAPVNAGTTYHLTDLFNNNSDDNFKGGMKYDDNPNAWLWVRNPVGDKTDMNHGLVHFTSDANGHTWITVASDRRSDGGDAYIDFEFLQNTLTMTGTTGGGFASAGPNGGRTVNDFLLTLSLSNGGSTAGFAIERWESIGGGKFDYIDRTALVPAGSVFAAVNTAVTPVSFGAFGNPSYATNTFVEGAIDLTALLSAIDACTNLGIKSLLIKTKTSTSPSATIVDLMAPLQIQKRLGIVDAGADQAKCSQGDSTKFALAGTATPSPGDVVSSATWSVVSGTAVIKSPNTLTTDVAVTSSSATLRLTVVTSPHNCVVSDDVILTVGAGPTVTLAAAGPFCVDAAAVQLVGTPAGGTYSGTGVSPSGLFTPATAGAGSWTITYNYTDATTQCANSAQRTIVVNPKPTVTLAAAGPFCADAAAVQLVGTPAGGTYSGTGVSPSGLFTPATAGAGSWTITYNYTDATTQCSNSAQRTIVVNPKPTVALPAAGPFCVDAAAVQLAGTPAGGTYSGTGVSPSGLFTPANAGAGSWTITYNYTDATTQCSNSAQRTIVVNPKPTVALPAAGPFCVDAAAVQLAGTPAGGTYSGTGVSPSGLFTPANAGAGSWTITYNYTDATTQCSNSAQRTIVVNPKPTVALPAAGPFCVDAAAVQLAGTPAGGTYSGTGVSPSGLFTPADAGAGSWTITYSFTNSTTQCSNSAQRTIVVNPKPTVALPAAGPFCVDAAAVQLAGTPAGGTYSGTGVSPSGLFTPANAGAGSWTITYNYTDATTQCSNSAQRTIVVNPKPTVALPAAGPFCVDAAAVQLAGTPAGGTYSGTGVSPSGLFTPSTAGAGSWTITYSFTNSTTQCANSAQRTIVVNPKPTVTLPAAGPFCANAAAVQLAGSPPNGTYSGKGVSANGLFSPASAGPGRWLITYSFTNASGCSNSTQQTVVVNAIATVNAGPNQTMCATGSPVTLAGSVGGSATGGTWTGGTGAFNPNRSTLNASYAPSAAEISAGTVTLTLTTNDPVGPCNAVSGQVVITISPAATVNAGDDQALCADNAVFTLAGSVGGAVTKGTWSGGAGAFAPNATTLNAKYTPTSAEIAAGSVTLTLTTDDPPGLCGPVSEGVVLTIRPLPPCTIYGPTAIATGDVAHLCGPEGSYTYLWSTGATTDCIDVQAGTYTLRVTDATTGCVSASCSHTVQLFTCACSVGYPDASSPPRSQVTFNESEVLRSFDPGPAACVSASGTIKMWYNDEHALTLGVRRVIVKTSSGTTTTDYPITPTPASPTCVSNPVVGTMSTNPDQSGNDVADGGGRPLWPVLFITDITSNPALRTGDWQQGGVGFAPHQVCGTWKAAVRTVDKTRTPTKVTVTPDSDPTKNNWNLSSGGDTPPGGFGSLVNEGYGCELKWNVAQLGLTPGHTYRMYFMVHDGDQNKTGGDVGHGCTTVRIQDQPTLLEATTTETATATATTLVLPKQFQLAQNFPNPFQGSTRFQFALPEPSSVSIKVYDLAGREVGTVIDGRMDAGEYEYPWQAMDHGRALAPGMYVYKMIARGEKTGQFQKIRKMIIID